MKKHQMMWLLIGLGLLAGVAYWKYKKDQAAAANNTSSIVQGSGVLSVLPNTSTTATPSGDTTWNHQWSSLNQQNAVKQTMPNPGGLIQLA